MWHFLICQTWAMVADNVITEQDEKMMILMITKLYRYNVYYLMMAINNIY